MKRILTMLLCVAMLTGSAAVAVQAEEETPLLILPNPTILANPTEEDILIAPNPFTEDSEVTEEPEEVAVAEEPADVVVGVEITPFEVSKKVKALVIGDSNACAYGSEKYIALNAATSEAPIEGSFGDIATKAMIGGSRTAAMFAMPGATTGNVLDLFTNPEKAGLTKAAVKQSNYIVYNIGGNDFLYPFAQKAAELTEQITKIMAMLEVSPVQAYLAFQTLTSDISAMSVECMANMTNNLSEILKETYLANPKAYVVVNGIPGIDLVKAASAIGMDVLANATVYELVTEAIASANDAINSVVKASQVAGMKVSFVDVNEAIFTDELPEDVEVFRADGVHFSDYAHTVVGEADTVAFKKLKRTDTLSLVRLLLISGN